MRLICCACAFRIQLKVLPTPREILFAMRLNRSQTPPGGPHCGSGPFLGPLGRPRPSLGPKPRIPFCHHSAAPGRGGNGNVIFPPRSPPAARQCSNRFVGPRTAPKTAPNGNILSVEPLSLLESIKKRDFLYLDPQRTKYYRWAQFQARLR